MRNKQIAKLSNALDNNFLMIHFWLSAMSIDNKTQLHGTTKALNRPSVPCQRLGKHKEGNYAPFFGFSLKAIVFKWCEMIQVSKNYWKIWKLCFYSSNFIQTILSILKFTIQTKLLNNLNWIYRNNNCQKESIYNDFLHLFSCISLILFQDS